MVPDAMQISYPSVKGAECPYPLYEKWRSVEPVRPVDGHPDWFTVSRYADCLYVLRHPEIYSSVGSRSRMASIDANLGDRRVEGVSMIDSDPPHHRDARSLCTRMFTPRRLRTYEPVIRRIADELIDAFADRGRVEFVNEFASPLSIRVTSELFGIPRADEQWIKEWGTLEASGLPWVSEERRRQQLVNGEQMREYLTEMLLDRYERPRDDVYSEIVQEQVRRTGTFDLAYALAQVSVLTAGGVITTAHLVGSAMLLLLSYPDQLAKVQADHELIPKMFDEAMRLESPSQWNPRVATVDTELAGVRIPAGSHVLVMFASANRDEQRWPAAERFDVTRPDANDHLAFGQGPHTCLGAQLARLEGRVAFEQLLTRLPGLRLAEGNDFTHLPSPSFRGLNHLLVEFD
jgi:cytochrome P450